MSHPHNRWRCTSPEGVTVDDVGARIVEIQRRYDEEFRDCSWQLGACFGFTSDDGPRGMLEEYLATTEKKGWPEGYSAFLMGLESGAITSALDLQAEAERGLTHRKAKPAE